MRPEYDFSGGERGKYAARYHAGSHGASGASVTLVEAGRPDRLMPRISEFYGIVIRMFYSDHAPPHFHAKYGRNEAAISIRTGVAMQGKLPPRAGTLVREWTKRHREELLANWELARVGRPLRRIPPLD